MLIGIAATAWLAVKATVIKDELQSVARLIPVLKENVAESKPLEAQATVDRLRAHAAEARASAGDPLWILASALPGVGANFSAMTEVAQSAEDVASLGASPLVKVFTSLNWDLMVPSNTAADLQPLKAAAPSVSAAAHAVRTSAERLARIDTANLLPQIAEPLQQARTQLETVTDSLDAAADASKVVPSMLGIDGTRQYLLIIQNNAEVRASGGIPGALAVVAFDNGKLRLDRQSSASAIGVMSPVLTVDAEQEQIYSTRLGKFMQDVNLTPDFPTAADLAQQMWNKKTGQRVDGVLSVDPVALAYILEATGPVKLSDPRVVALAGSDLPTELTGKNVVQALLSDVYAQIEEPTLQDEYFAGVAQELFATLSDGQKDAKRLLEGITRGVSEGRVLVWSNSSDEQAIIKKYDMSGAINGPSVSPTQFGVYFNDGTGAKMDYYVKRSVQLFKECTTDGYSQVRVRVKSMNTAPANAAESLPAYVTGAGAFGVPAGTVQTNIVAYGPVQSNVESALADGKKISFASQVHSGRPVGTVTVALPPGKSSTIEFTFGKIVQHTEPVLSVTPTVQAREDAVLDTVAKKCAPAV